MSPGGALLLASLLLAALPAARGSPVSAGPGEGEEGLDPEQRRLPSGPTEHLVSGCSWPPKLEGLSAKRPLGNADSMSRRLSPCIGKHPFPLRRYAVDNHRSFNDKHGGLAGKRDLRPEDGAGAGDLERPLPVGDDDVRKIMEFLTFLHLREAGALLPMLPSAASWEDTELPARREPGRALPPQDARL
uniref:Galanin peptides n=1 Tax=Pipistrellus kuhlii TaxID=59472 RepID=A0A7J7WZV1_PIPKU|nr:galanin and GMAP prepropeptide [Pipistrellus kuhlii]